ncbi:hypothetical protein C8A05DRAFT_40044, partial [Staphylotrichum tortipilum]
MAQTSTTRTTRKVVMRPGGDPMQVTETEQHIVVKKTVWTRVLTGGKKAVAASNWKYHITNPGQAVKRIIPHSAKEGKDSCGYNMSYYRKTFLLLNRQTQVNLYIGGLAPKMTENEVKTLRKSGLQFNRPKPYMPERVMYDAHVSPSGHRAAPRDLIADSKDAKRAAAAGNPDALPAFLTPAAATKIQAQEQHQAGRPTKLQPKVQQHPQPQRSPQQQQQQQQ